MMRKFLITTVAAFIAIASYGQMMHVDAAGAAQLKAKATLLPDNYQYNDFKAAKLQSGNRGVSEIQIDYSFSDNVSVDNELWRVNADFDDSDTLTLRYAIVAFDSLYDSANDLPVPYPSVDSLSIDTVYYFLSHENVSGQNDTIVVSVIELDAFGNPTGNDPILWSDTTITDTNLTNPGFFGLQFVAPHLTLQPNVKFGIRIDFYGPKTDVFGVRNGYLDDCGGACFANASDFTENSWYHLNWVTSTGNSLSGFQSSNNLGADCNMSGGPFEEDACEFFFIQNIMIIPQLTVYQSLFVQTTPDTVVCSGDLVTLTATPLGGSGNYNYTWSPGGSCPTCQSTDIIPTASGTYTVTVEDIDDMTTFDVDVQVDIAELNIDVGADQTIECGDEINIVGQITGNNAGTQGLMHQWSLDGNDINGETNSSLTNVSEAGTYTLTSVNAVGCEVSDDVVVTINTNQDVSFTFDPHIPNEFDTLYINNTVNFNNTSAEKAGWDWRWNFGDDPGTSNSLENPTHIYLTPNINTITLEAIDQTNSACTLRATKDVVVIDNVGIVTVNGKTIDFRVFPNPAQGNVNIAYESPENDDITLSVINLQGKELFSQQYANVSKVNQTIDLGDFAKGVYMVRIVNSEAIITEKLTVLH